MTVAAHLHHHHGPGHPESGHHPSADPACAMAHGDLPPPDADRHLVVVFASPVARELALLAPRLGWTVVTLDPDADRRDSGTCSPTVATVAEAALDDHTDVVVCDHDRPELGELLAEVLRRPSRWVGVMGSLRHTAPHVAALQARGLAPDAIARVHRPIGLDIGSRSPAEIAVSTLAGLLADRSGRSGASFAPSAGPTG